MAKYDKYRDMDWKSIQEKYDSGIPASKLGHCSCCITWATKNGYLKTDKSKMLKFNYSSGKIDLSPWRTKKHRQVMSKLGGIRANAGRCKSITHISPIAGEVKLNGSWEQKYAFWLDENNIKWIRNTKSFPYEFEGKVRKYYPDFYLVDENRYIEIKGYETDKDRAKWSQFKNTLTVLKRNELTSSPYNFNLR
jgi:hypothetical protein